MDFPRSKWSSLTNLAYRGQERRRFLQRLRDEQRPPLEFVEEVFDMQLQHGDDALLEQPLRSEAMREVPIERILNHPDVHAGVVHGCQYGVRNIQTNELFKKPTMWISTSPGIIEELPHKCNNTHGLGTR